MSMKEDVLQMKKEVQEIRTQSLAMELIRDYKKQNKRQFITIMVILLLWFVTIGILVYVLNDIGVEETTTETTTTTQEIEDVGSIDNSYIINGDNYGKDKNN